MLYILGQYVCYYELILIMMKMLTIKFYERKTLGLVYEKSKDINYEKWVAAWSIFLKN